MKVNSFLLNFNKFLSNSWFKVRIFAKSLESFYNSVTENLREINFEDSRSVKNAVLPFKRALNFVNLVNFSFQNVQKFIKIGIQSIFISSNVRFCPSRIPKIDLTSDSKDYENSMQRVAVDKYFVKSNSQYFTFQNNVYKS